MKRNIKTDLTKCLTDDEILSFLVLIDFTKNEKSSTTASKIMDESSTRDIFGKILSLEKKGILTCEYSNITKIDLQITPFGELILGQLRENNIYLS